MFTCEFCSNSFTTKYNLNTHVKKSKTCIDLRTTLNISLIEPNNNFTCENCNKVFVSQYNLNRHINNFCKSRESNQPSVNSQIEEKNHENKYIVKKYEKLIEEQNLYFKEQIEYYKNQVNVLLEKLTSYTSQNNSNNSLNNSLNNSQNININYIGVDLSQTRFDKIVKENFDYKLYEKSGEGGKLLLCKFFTNEDNKLAIEITDYARDKLKSFDINKKENVFLTKESLLDYFKNSNAFKEIIEEHHQTRRTKEDDPCFSHNYYIQKINNMYTTQKAFTKNVYKPLKASLLSTYISSNEHKENESKEDDRKENDHKQNDQQIDDSSSSSEDEKYSTEYRNYMYQQLRKSYIAEAKGPFISDSDSD